MRYQCERCGRSFASLKEAAACERSHGEVVLGWRVELSRAADSGKWLFGAERLDNLRYVQATAYNLFDHYNLEASETGYLCVWKYVRGEFSEPQMRQELADWTQAWLSMVGRGLSRKTKEADK